MQAQLQWDARLTEGSRTRARRAEAILLSPGPSSASTNFYPPSVVAAAAHVFSGSKAFLDHATSEEEATQPERSVRKQCGFWEGCHVGVDGALVGTLNLAGAGADEAAATLEAGAAYARKFPDRGQDWCGFSISAGGSSHPENSDALVQQYPQWRRELARLPQWDVVDEIGAGGTCDLVTRGAARGKLLRLLESMRKKEGSMNSPNDAAILDLRRLAKGAESQKPEAIAALLAALDTYLNQELHTPAKEAETMKNLEWIGLHGSEEEARTCEACGHVGAPDEEEADDGGEPQPVCAACGASLPTDDDNTNDADEESRRARHVHESGAALAAAFREAFAPWADYPTIGGTGNAEAPRLQPSTELRRTRPGLS